MKIVIQRVKEAKVTVNQEQIAAIKTGFLLLVGIKSTDTLVEVKKAAAKISKMRIFEDENNQMNLALKDVGGTILSVSQFTLLADTKKGNRPSFTAAMKPKLANQLFENFNDELRKLGLKVQTGQFGADMDVQLVNDGPVTIVLDY